MAKTVLIYHDTDSERRFDSWLRTAIMVLNDNWQKAQAWSDKVTPRLVILESVISDARRGDAFSHLDAESRKEIESIFAESRPVEFDFERESDGRIGRIFVDMRLHFHLNDYLFMGRGLMWRQRKYADERDHAEDLDKNFHRIVFGKQDPEDIVRVLDTCLVIDRQANEFRIVQDKYEQCKSIYCNVYGDNESKRAYDKLKELEGEISGFCTRYGLALTDIFTGRGRLNDFFVARCLSGEMRRAAMCERFI